MSDTAGDMAHQERINDLVQGAVRLERIELGISHLREMFSAMREAQGRQSVRLDQITAAQTDAAHHPTEITRLADSLREFTAEHKKWRESHEEDNDRVETALDKYIASNDGAIKGLKVGLLVLGSSFGAILVLLGYIWQGHLADSRENRSRIEHSIQGNTERLNRLDGRGNVSTPEGEIVR